MPNSSSPSRAALATGAAIGFFAGLAVPHARKALAQGPSVAAGGWMEALKAEHRLVEKTFELALRTTERDVAKREMLLMKIAYALTKHAVEEENVIYPALAESGFADAAQKLVEDHGRVKTFIYELRSIAPDDVRWRSTIQAFFTDLQSHIREEEEEIFPQLAAKLTPEREARLTRMMNWEGYKVA